MKEKCEPCIWRYSGAIRRLTANWGKALWDDDATVEGLRELIKVEKKRIDELEKAGCIKPITRDMVMDSLDLALKRKTKVEMADDFFDAIEKIRWHGSRDVAKACLK